MWSGTQKYMSEVLKSSQTTYLNCSRVGFALGVPYASDATSTTTIVVVFSFFPKFLCSRLIAFVIQFPKTSTITLMKISGKYAYPNISEWLEYDYFRQFLMLIFTSLLGYLSRLREWIHIEHEANKMPCHAGSVVS